MFQTDSNVLIVDDASAIRTLVRGHLGSYGIESVYEAGNGQEACDLLEKLKAESKKIDLAIIDWKMPVMDGVELIRFMKHSADYRKIPILMIAAEREVEKVVDALNAGATGFLGKPFDADELKEKMEVIWEELKHGTLI